MCHITFTLHLYEIRYCYYYKKDRMVMEFQFEAASASVTGEFPARVLSSNFSESKPSGFVPQPKHLNFYSSMTAGCKAIC